MKAKKLLIPLLLLLCCMLALAGCTPKTEYDDKEVDKIETQIYGGYTLIAASYKRTFDFNDNTVIDEPFVNDKESTIEYLLELYNPNTNAEYGSIDEYKTHLQSYFNTPKEFESFSQEQADRLLKKIKSHGIYTWKESYVSNKVDDASWHSITITFKDGTVKTSRFYCDYPNNFDKIVSAFNDTLGVGLWFGTYDYE